MRKLTLIFLICTMNCQTPPKISENISENISNCDYTRRIITLRNWGNVAFPSAGRAVREAHYITVGELTPFSTTSKIEFHILRSCKILKSTYSLNLSTKCSEIYNRPGAGSWTPAEGGGKIGHGSTSKKPTVIQELWQANMFWARGHRPTIGEKWIVKNPKNKKAVVVSMGFETGPGGKRWLAGISSETDWFLNNDQSKTRLNFGIAKDQSLKYGPIDCKVSF